MTAALTSPLLQATTAGDGTGRLRPPAPSAALDAVRFVLLVIGLFALVSVLGNMIAQHGVRPSFASLSRFGAHFLALYTCIFAPAALLLGLADRLPFAGRARVASLVAALAVAALASGCIEAAAFDCAPECGAPASRVWWSYVAQKALYHFFLGSAVALAYFSRRRDETIASALRASELGRIDAEREHLRAELTAMQARVEPAFLLAALRDVGALFERDPADGARMLELLSRYLRTALPRMRDSTGTVGREIELARSYAEIVAMRARGALVVECRVEPDAADERLAPMLLLPLVAGITRGADADGMLSLRARNQDGAILVTIEADGTVARRLLDSPVIDEVRTRLAAIHGGHAAIALTLCDAGVARIDIHVPHEPPHRHPR